MEKVKAVDPVTSWWRHHPLGLSPYRKREVKAALVLCDPTDWSPPGSSVHGILQARIVEWVAILFSRGSSPPKDQTPVSGISGGFFTI